MRSLGVLLLFSVTGLAQTPQPPALLRGVLIECDTPGPNGQLSVRAADNQVFRFQFDRKTYVERENQLIDIARLKPGERVEVLSDSLPGLLLRYARTIHVVQPAPPPRPQPAPGSRSYRPPPVRTGNLTFSGVVYRLSPERLVLHTRDGGDQAILLRQDTRYLENGNIVDLATLKTNLRVFIRAGKDLYDQVEAYQVIWGKILDPR